MMRKVVQSLSRERGFALVACAAIYGLLWLTAANALAYNIVNRWSSTQIDGGGLQRGDPVTLRWSIVPDGQSYSRSNNSELVGFLDAAWGVRPGPRRFDFTSRPWWTVIDNAYAQYSRVSGVALTYVPELTLDGTSTGQVSDIRISGEIIDGTLGGILADNTFPNAGDMRIDTSRGSDGSIGSYFRTEPGLRNLVIHETGHGVGLGHAEFVNNSAKAVLEGGLRTDIWGLQFDDVYALNRQYGDPRERDGGNDNAITASVLSDFGTAGSVSIGADAIDSVVEQFDDDWVGIDGANDLDWYRFSVTGECFANILLTPVGPTYTTVAQGLFNAAAMSDLDLQLFRDGPRLTRVTTVDQHGVGDAEWIPAQLLSEVGDYLIRIAGEQDFNQFYQLDILVVETVWNTPDIWIRRTFDVPEDASDRWRLLMHHDDEAEVYVNGVLAKQARRYTSDYERYSLFKAALAAIKPSGNVLAVHCHRTGGGQYIDVGIVALDPADEGLHRAK